MFGQPIRISVGKNLVLVGASAFPLSTDSSDRHLTLLIDGCSVELFSGDGQALMTAPLLCDYNINRLVLTSDSPASVERLEISRLRPATH